MCLALGAAVPRSRQWWSAAWPALFSTVALAELLILSEDSRYSQAGLQKCFGQRARQARQAKGRRDRTIPVPWAGVLHSCSWHGVLGPAA